MLEEVTPLAVIAPVGYLDLLAVHVVLDLKVPHSLSVRMIPVDSLQKEPRPRPRKGIDQGQEVQRHLSQLLPLAGWGGRGENDEHHLILAT